jgi:ubiquitin C-terminal hydrolase
MEGTSVIAKYSLYAIIVHWGNRRSSGHFTSYVRKLTYDANADGDFCSTDVNKIASWYHMNDAEVTPSTIDDVLKQSPYLLFYIRDP